ncbi:YceI family protein [bacterium]|nr:YceI family protein [bacterium]
MFRNRCFVFVVLLFVTIHFQDAKASDFSMSQIYPIDREHSYIGFSIRYMGFAKVRGRFTDFSGTFLFDEKDITQSSGTILIKVESLDTDYDFRDKDLRSANWFDAEKYPFIKFQTKRVLRNGSNVEAVGDLTIKGVTKEVQIKMDYCSGRQKDVRGDTQVVLTGGAIINRKDFGVEGEKWSKIKEGISAVAFDVDIELSILGTQINAPNFTNWVNDPNTPHGKIYKMIAEGNIENGIQEFRKMKAASEKEIAFDTLDTVAHMLLKENKVTEAIRIFQENAESYPDDSNVYDSLAEAYSVQGDRANAIKHYKKSLEKDPYNANAIEVLRNLE